jgi:hypothetical protein
MRRHWHDERFAANASLLAPGGTPGRTVGRIINGGREPRIVQAPREPRNGTQVGGDDRGGPGDRGRGCHPDAVHAQRAVSELARHPGGAGVQDGRVDGRAAPGDLVTVRHAGSSPLYHPQYSLDITSISIWPTVGILSYCLTMNELRSRRRVAAGGRRSVDAVRDPAEGA